MSDALIWTTIIGLAIGTYLIRFSFLGLLGGRELPLTVKQLLNYTSVAVLPGIAAPLVVPIATESFEPMRLLAAGVLVCVGILTRHMMWALMSGLLCYFGGRWLFGI